MKKFTAPGFYSLNPADLRLGEGDQKLQTKFGHATCHLMLSHGANAILQSL